MLTRGWSNGTTATWLQATSLMKSAGQHRNSASSLSAEWFQSTPPGARFSSRRIGIATRHGRYPHQPSAASKSRGAPAEAHGEDRQHLRSCRTCGRAPQNRAHAVVARDGESDHRKRVTDFEQLFRAECAFSSTLPCSSRILNVGSARRTSGEDQSTTPPVIELRIANLSRRFRDSLRKESREAHTTRRSSLHVKTSSWAGERLKARQGGLRSSFVGNAVNRSR